MTTYLNPESIPGWSDAETGKVITKGSDGVVYKSTIDAPTSAVKEGQVLTAGATTGATAWATITGTAPAYIAQTGAESPTSEYYTKGQSDTLLNAKQATLVSGTNIKTINNTSLLGSANISIPNLSFNHITPTVSSNALVFDDTLTGGNNRCYARVSISDNLSLTLSFTNSDEHYITIQNTSASAVTVAVGTVTGYQVLGNTAISIAASKYYEVSFLKSGTDYILTERQLTTA